ncbi:hypothetical protein BC628DRAFT_1340879 [Trametes gibbosa]|nr:hypothetical protein BC628DRAFT_1340879 [Trametes gibbosa]
MAAIVWLCAGGALAWAAGDFLARVSLGPCSDGSGSSGAVGACRDKTSGPSAAAAAAVRARRPTHLRVETLAEANGRSRQSLDVERDKDGDEDEDKISYLARARATRTSPETSCIMHHEC